MFFMEIRKADVIQISKSMRDSEKDGERSKAKTKTNDASLSEMTLSKQTTPSFSSILVHPLTRWVNERVESPHAEK